MTEAPSELNEPALAAEARGRGYVLLADLLERGPLEKWLAPMKASASLAAALESYPDLDEAAADHEYVFGQSVHPYVGVFIDEAARAGGPATSKAQAALEQIGYAADPTGPGLEHLATMLRALAFLSGAEVDARRDEQTDILEHLEDLSRRFIDAEILPWLALFTDAVLRTERAWPVALATHIDELVRLHRETLGGDPAAEPIALPESELDLEAEGSSLRDIAHHLAIPAFTGVLISRHDVTVIGRRYRAPRGFGPRHRLVHTLMHSAVGYEVLDEVLGEFTALVQRQLDLMADTARVGKAAQYVGASYVERGEATLALLERIREAAARGGYSDEEAPEPTSEDEATARAATSTDSD